MEPRDKAIMPIEPEFRDDREFLPLQAADMLAWLWRRAAEYGPNSFDWVARELNVVEMSPQSAVFSAKRMKDIVEHSFELRFTEKEIDEYKRRYNLPTNDAKRNWKTPKMPPKRVGGGKRRNENRRSLISSIRRLEHFLPFRILS